MKSEIYIKKMARELPTKSGNYHTDKGELWFAQPQNEWVVRYGSDSTEYPTIWWEKVQLPKAEPLSMTPDELKDLFHDESESVYDMNAAESNCPKVDDHKPVTYTKPEHPGKTFIKLTNIKYE